MKLPRIGVMTLLPLSIGMLAAFAAVAYYLYVFYPYPALLFYSGTYVLGGTIFATSYLGQKIEKKFSKEQTE